MAADVSAREVMVGQLKAWKISRAWQLALMASKNGIVRKGTQRWRRWGHAAGRDEMDGGGVNQVSNGEVAEVRLRVVLTKEYDVTKCSVCKLSPTVWSAVSK